MRRSQVSRKQLLSAIGLALLVAIIARPSDAADKWALLVGINGYRNVTPLRYSVSDVTAMRDLLVSQCGYRADHVYVMTDESKGEEAPTHNNILFLFGELAEKLGPQDSFLFYFSGHGMEAAGRQYLLAINADPRNVETLEATAVPLSKLRDKTAQMKAKHVVFLLDACRNNPRPGMGESANALGEGMAKMVQVVARAGAAGAEGSAVLFSCKQGERAYEWAAKEHSIFGYYLLRGLSGEAADPQTGEVMVWGLADYLQRMVPPASQLVTGEEAQHPWLAAEGSARIVLARASSPAPQAAVRELPTAAILRVTSIPAGATVNVDGSVMGTTPCDITIALGVAARRQVTVTVEKAGFAARKAEVTVNAGQVSEWPQVRLDPLPPPHQARPMPAGPRPARRPIAGDDIKSLPWPREPFHTLTETGGWVGSVAFSPDGRLLASSSADNTIKLWEVATGQLRGTLRGYTAAVQTLAFSPDGHLLASGLVDNTVRLWEVDSGRQVAQLRGHIDWVLSVAFSPDATRLASGSRDSTVRLWDTGSWACLTTLSGHSAIVFEVAFSPDGRLLASASLDATVKLWDVESGECLETLWGHSGWVAHVVFSPDGATLASAGAQDKTIKLWDTESGACLHTLSLSGLSASPDSMAFSPGGSLLASISHDETLRIWDAESGDCLYTLPRDTHEMCTARFSHDGKLLASVLLHDLNSGRSSIGLWRMPRFWETQ